MKKCFVLTSLILVILVMALNSYGRNHEPMSRTQMDSLAKTYACFSAMVALVDLKTPPVMQKFSEKVNEQAWDYLETLKYLDSLPRVASRLYIFGYEHYSIDEQGLPYLRIEARKNQDSFFYKVKDEYIIGIESSYNRKLLTRDIIVQEQKDAYQFFTDVGIMTDKGIPNDDEFKIIVDQLCSLDVSLRLMQSGSPVIGTEPQAIYLTEQFIVYGKQALMESTIIILNRARSEYALASMIRWIVENDYRDKAVLAYGWLHLVDFEAIYKKYGLTYQLI